MRRQGHRPKMPRTEEQKKKRAAQQKANRAYQRMLKVKLAASADGKTRSVTSAGN